MKNAPVMNAARELDQRAQRPEGAEEDDALEGGLDQLRRDSAG